MYRRHSGATTSSMQPPSQYQRHSSVATSAPALFRESSERSRSISFSIFDDVDHRKYSKTALNRHTLYWRILPCLVLLFLPWIPHQRTRWQIKARKGKIDQLILEQKELVQKLDDTTESIRSLKKEIEILTKDNELSFQEIHRSGKKAVIDMESKEYASLEEEEHALVTRIEKLEKAVQKNSAKRVKDRYGIGPHQVRVSVRNEATGTKSTFVIVTAMVMEMPHAIDHFFRMIEAKLWDGLALIHEPDSKVIMATPMTTDDSHSWAGQRFREANLTHMAFNEHSPTFPPPHHRKFSVGFSGRPGGPNFYINLDDELDYAHEHESIFGVVLEGRDVLIDLFLRRRGNDGSKKILTISNIEILETKPEDDQ